jgi:hypothetical protein
MDLLALQLLQETGAGARAVRQIDGPAGAPAAAGDRGRCASSQTDRLKINFFWTCELIGFLIFCVSCALARNTQHPRHVMSLNNSAHFSPGTLHNDKQRSPAFLGFPSMRSPPVSLSCDLLRHLKPWGLQLFQAINLRLQRSRPSNLTPGRW